MRNLRIIICIIVGVLALIMSVTLVAYVVKFSNLVSDRREDWSLFISLINWFSTSVLTCINIWVFYKLTTVIEENNSRRFVENKMNDTEHLIRKLRIDDYNELRECAAKVILALGTENNSSTINATFTNFRFKLQTMCVSSLYSYTDDIGSTQIEVLCNEFDNFMRSNSENKVAIQDMVSRVVKTIEIIIFTNQLRDERLCSLLREHPEHFDSTLVSIDEFIKKKCNHAKHS